MVSNLADSGGLLVEVTGFVITEIRIITTNRLIWNLLFNTIRCDNTIPALLNAKVNAKQEA